MSTTIAGIVTGGVVVPNSPLPEGAKVEVTVLPEEAKPARLSMLAFLETLPQGPRAFKTWEEYEQHLREEKDAWFSSRTIATSERRECADGNPG